MSLHKLIRVVSILVAITGLSLRGGGRGPGISASYYERLPRLLSKENRTERNS